MGIWDSSAASRILAQIRQCRSTRGVANAQRLHKEAAAAGLDRDTRIGNSLVQMYASSSSLTEARLVFERISTRNDISWNVIIAAHIQNGHLEAGCDIFVKMPLRCVVTWNTVIAALSKKGRLHQARGCFDSCPQRNDVTWNSLVTAYAQNGHLEEARRMLTSAPQFSKVAWTVIVSALIHKGNLEDARKMFDEMPEQDVVACTIMFTAYAQKGHLRQAREMFDGMPVKDETAWTIMLQSYAQNGGLAEARMLFDQIPEPYLRCCNAMLAAYVHARLMHAANELFEAMKVRDVITWTTMVSGYAQNGDMVRARRTFDATPVQERDGPAWSAMITGYGQCGHPKEALELFLVMDQAGGGTPTNQAFISALDACANLHAVAQGRIIHEEAVRSGIRGSEVEVFNVLVTMYGTFGDLRKAKALFDEAPTKDLVSWTALMTAFALNGKSRDALETYRLMLVEGVEPDDVTFVSILSACSHAGLIEDGIGYMIALVEFHGMQPNDRHLSCMVDLLARAGRTQTAQEVLLKCQPNENAWKSMAGFSLIQGDVRRVGFVLENATERQDLKDSSLYVLWSQTHASQFEERCSSRASNAS